MDTSSPQYDICVDLTDVLLQGLETSLVLTLQRLEDLVVPMDSPTSTQFGILAHASRLNHPSDEIHLVLPDVLLLDEIDLEELKYNI